MGFSGEGDFVQAVFAANYYDVFFAEDFAGFGD